MKKNTQMLSAMNKYAILNLLKDKGPCSRADIARELSLSFPAVSSNARSLIEEGLVFEAGEGNNALGRKSILLSFNANRAYLVGVDIGRYQVRAMCADIAGNVKAYYRVKGEDQQIFDVVAGAITQVSRQAGVNMDSVTAIGVGIPGIYDEQKQKHIMAPFVEKWDDPDLFEKIRRQYPLAAVEFENSVKLGSVGEHWQGCAQGRRSIVYIEFGVGIGAAILTDGKLMRGANGAAGEIGYMTLEKEILRRQFTNMGSLEQLFPSQLISKYISGDPEQIDMNVVMDELRVTIPQQYIDNLPNYFAMSIINTVSVINPEIVVISGKLGCALYRHYEQEIKDQLHAHVPFVPEIACTSLNGRANVLGAISLAAKRAFPGYQGLGLIE